ncbi:MAG: hypothetical protein JW846_01585 [Dehalococcoidia bacterium]|nr:hypothetical protein [Dehalococcoidia bacterium]
MEKILKVITVTLGIILIAEGLLDIVMPEQRLSLMGTGENASHVLAYMTILGATWVAAGIWVVVAGRDPLRHIDSMKFVITLPLLLAFALAYSTIKGYVTFDQVAVDLVVDILFALVLFVLYPRRAAIKSQKIAANES